MTSALMSSSGSLSRPAASSRIPPEISMKNELPRVINRKLELAAEPTLPAPSRQEPAAMLTVAVPVVSVPE